MDPAVDIQKFKNSEATSGNMCFLLIFHPPSQTPGAQFNAISNSLFNKASGIMLRLSYSAETVLRRENLCISTLPELVHLLKAQEFLSNPTNSNTLILIKCTAPWQNE